MESTIALIIVLVAGFIVGGLKTDEDGIIYKIANFLLGTILIIVFAVVFIGTIVGLIIQHTN